MQILFLRDSFALEKMIHSVGSACNEGHKDVVHFLILNIDLNAKINRNELQLLTLAIMGPKKLSNFTDFQTLC